MYYSRGRDISGNRETFVLLRIWHFSEADDNQSTNNWSSGDTSDEETKWGRILLHVHISDQRALLRQGDIWVIGESARTIDKDGKTFLGEASLGSEKHFWGEHINLRCSLAANTYWRFETGHWRQNLPNDVILKQITLLSQSLHNAVPSVQMLFFQVNSSGSLWPTQEDPSVMPQILPRSPLYRHSEPHPPFPISLVPVS